MNLIIDSGNTYTKLALFDGRELTKKQTVKTGDYEKFEVFIRRFSAYCKKLIFSSVALGDDKARAVIERYYSKYVVFSHRSQIPITNHYKSPETLGLDRLAGAVGANALFPGNHLLVFDAGSCITWDFVHRDNGFMGGGISPGIDMRFRALHNFTARLPLVSERRPEKLYGQDTVESITAGVAGGIIAEVNGLIDKFQDQYPDIKVVFTGGDAIYFDKKLKNNIFAHPNLVLLGLNIILDINA